MLDFSQGHRDKILTRAMIDSTPPATNAAAIINPHKINPAARQNVTPNINAISAPVHPPLPGSGIATNPTNAIAPISINNFECLCRVWSKTFSMSFFRNSECFLAKFVIGSRIFNKIRTTKKFPINAHIIDELIGNPRVFPIGIPRRSSPIGVIEAKNTRISGGSCKIVSREFLKGDCFQYLSCREFLQVTPHVVSFATPLSIYWVYVIFCIKKLHNRRSIPQWQIICIH